MKNKFVVMLGAAAVCTACGPDPSERLLEPLDIVQLDVDDRQVFVNRTTGYAIVIDPVRDDGPALEISSHPIGAVPGAAAVSVTGEVIYSVDEENDLLVILDPETGERTDVELDSPFDRIAVDPEGEFLLLYFGGSSGQQIVARNLNEVGIVDLRKSTPSATFLTLASRPQSIEFAPRFELGGQSQRIAAVASQNEVTILDLEELDDPDEALREVGLTLSEADEVRTPRDIQFDVTPDESQPDVAHVYVLTDRSTDVAEISITPTTAADAEHKFAVSVNELAAGAQPTVMRLLELPAGSRLVTLSASTPQFTIVDVASGEGATFDLPLTAPATRLLEYQTTVESAGETHVETRLLAHTPNSPIVAVIRPEIIPVAGDEPTLGRSVEAIRLERTPSRIRLATDQLDRAIVFHEGPSAGFTILDLRKNNDIPIQGGTLSDIHFDGSFAYAVYQSLKNFTIFGLDGHPTNFDLPEVGVDVFLDSEDELLVVRHPDETGAFTVLDANEPTPENARVYGNLFIRDLFDLELEP